ncbi:MAG: glycine--tRNA ligase subunit beta, partial [Parvibaculum sp.]
MGQLDRAEILEAEIGAARNVNCGVSQRERPYAGKEAGEENIELPFIGQSFLHHPEKRQEKIIAEVKATAKKAGGIAEISSDLLNEVTNLVEWPTAVIGKFDDSFLILPPEVITMVMVTHQRYFPVLKPENDGNKTGKPTKELLPYFITISNGDPAKSAIIANGNERVIRARLADGQFFYKADIAKP